MPRPLTRRQHQVLRAIQRSQEETGLSPTLEELGKGLGVNRITAYGHVQALLQKGFLENLEPGASRGLDLTETGRSFLDASSPALQRTRVADGPTFSVPLLGRIAAGCPIEAIELPETKDIQDFFPGRDDLFMLEVKGESMIEDHIQDGDWVLVRRDQPPKNGDTVVAILEDEEATLKRFYREPGGTYRLQPANASLAPIYVDELEIRGVVVSIYRRLS
ncbi:MAG: transcriptional repressor LexA [Planctomycetes bacterium]|nr:transcriptional repressor LexA [Planctomycetota bacterium]